MLVLSRQTDEGVLLGTEFQVRVVEIKQERVKIRLLRDNSGKNEWLDVERERWMVRDEELDLGQGMIISIVDVRGDKMRLGIVAPAHLQVHRKEVYDVLNG